MPLPLILGTAAAIAGTAGVGSAIHGTVKMVQANSTMKSSEERHKRNLARFEIQNKETSYTMDRLGTLELEILKSFDNFSKVFEKIKNKPEFKEYHKDGVKIPKYDGEELKKVSVGAGVLIGGLGGSAMGTAGGFAAAGAAKAAVMALGCASTGTPIAALHGIAATKATLAALGGGAISAGGGGIALGTTMLGVTTLGVGLLVGGIIFGITGTSLSNKADKAKQQVSQAEREINRICHYMMNLRTTAQKYESSLSNVNAVFQRHLSFLEGIVYVTQKEDWNRFSEEEKLATENTVLLVGLLYRMCKVQLVLKAENEKELNKINSEEIQKAMLDAENFLKEKGFTIAA